MKLLSRRLPWRRSLLRLPSPHLHLMRLLRLLVSKWLCCTILIAQAPNSSAVQRELLFRSWRRVAMVGLTFLLMGARALFRQTT